MTKHLFWYPILQRNNFIQYAKSYAVPVFILQRQEQALLPILENTITLKNKRQ